MLKIDEQVVKDTVKVLGQDETLMLTMEECSELQKECSKVFRCKGNRANLVEEMGDVLICIDYLKELYNISDAELQETIDHKMFRTKKRIDLNTLTLRGGK